MRRVRRPILLVTCLSTVCLSAAAQDSGIAQKSLEGREAETTYTMKLEAKGREQRQCVANLSLSYVQKHTVAAVESTLINDQCGSSGGSYTIAVRFKDDAGELHTTEFEETWYREGRDSIETSKEYLIGENVDLVNVRARRLRCLCEDPLSEAENE